VIRIVHLMNLKVLVEKLALTRLIGVVSNSSLCDGNLKTSYYQVEILFRDYYRLGLFSSFYLNCVVLLSNICYFYQS
jgi:hypothetical protein